MPVTDRSVRFSFLTEFHLITEDLHKVLQYVDQSDENLNTFSHRIYELLLRTCTAFETVCTNVLKDQVYILPSGKRNMDIKDYFTLNDEYKLNEFKVQFGSWRSGVKDLKPFESWNSSSFASLVWYQAYNHAKHDRHLNFKEANLGNLINAYAGLFVLLYALYAEDVFGEYQYTPMYHTDENVYMFSNDSILSIKEP